MLFTMPPPPLVGTINSLRNLGVLMARTRQAIPQKTFRLIPTFIIIPTPSLQRLIYTMTATVD